MTLTVSIFVYKYQCNITIAAVFTNTILLNGLNLMEKALSPHEQFISERDKKISSRYLELREAGTDKLMAYRIIAGEMTPPIHEATISRLLARKGLNLEPSKFGRPRKVEKNMV